MPTPFGTPPRARIGLLALALLPVLPASLAHADEDESALRLNMSFAGYAIPDHSPKGGGLGIDYERGVSDAVWLRASAGGALLYDAGSPAYAASGQLGISYVLDVLRYIPHIDLGIGGVYLHGADVDEPFLPLIQIGGGLDMLVSRQRSYGIFARFESFTNSSAFFNVGARMSWRWGFF